MDQRQTAQIDGPRDEGTRTFLVGERVELNEMARQQLSSVQVPILLDAKNPHARLFVAALDGTGNDFIHDPQHATNVGLIYEQIKEGGNDRIRAGYVEGTGTQPNWVTRLSDGARGYTSAERAEQMYDKFIHQAKQWLHDDPHALISIAGVGFSRGGEEVALFARMVEERGIQDPTGAKYTYDAQHQIRHVEYIRPALGAPGQTAQAVLLFDPVGAGQPMHEDRRLPPSVISGLQLNAMDELRRLFRSDHIIDPGFTVDGRFAGLNLAGSHSDVGGGYLLNGLSNSAGNVGIAYLNALSSQPFLHELPVSDDPLRNVIHRSADGMLLYGVDYKVDRSTPKGYNEHLVDKHMAPQVVDADNGEPRNERLNARFAHQPVSKAMQDTIAEPSACAAPSDLDKLIDCLYRAAMHDDVQTMDAVSSDYLRTPQGQAWQQQVMQGDQLRQLPGVAQQPAPVQTAHQGPAM